MKEIFSTALARLTGMYLLVLASVCIVFSSFIYNFASNEIERSSQKQVAGFKTRYGAFIVDEVQTEQLRSQASQEAKTRLRAQLVVANVVVIGGGVYFCYVFAKRTLRPIEENMHAQERFTSDASHELRTPLAVMMSEIEVALRDPKLSLDEAKILLKSNLEEVQSMHAMAENLLTLARGKAINLQQNVDPSEVVESVIDRTKSKLGSIQLSRNVKPSKLYTSEDALAQVLSILLDNAIKHSGAKKISISGEAKRSSYIITVHDDGRGLPQDIQPHIFDRFSRGDASRTSQAIEGHGLGLAIARQLVEALNGTISINQKRKKGAEFRVILPRGVQST